MIGLFSLTTPTASVATTTCVKTEASASRMRGLPAELSPRPLEPWPASAGRATPMPTVARPSPLALRLPASTVPLASRIRLEGRGTVVAVRAPAIVAATASLKMMLVDLRPALTEALAFLSLAASFASVRLNGLECVVRHPDHRYLDSIFNKLSWFHDDEFEFQLDSDPCLDSPCLNNGTCHFSAQMESHVCVCGEGFSGSRCEVDLCARLKCPPNSLCIKGEHCKCLPGFIRKTDFLPI